MRIGNCNSLGKEAKFYSDEYLWNKKNKFIKKILIFSHIIFDTKDPELFKYKNTIITNEVNK